MSLKKYRAGSITSNKAKLMIVTEIKRPKTQAGVLIVRSDSIVELTDEELRLLTDSLGWPRGFFALVPEPKPEPKVEAPKAKAKSGDK
jgi:hypothetical protein